MVDPPSYEKLLKDVETLETERDYYKRESHKNKLRVGSLLDTKHELEKEVLSLSQTVNQKKLIIDELDADLAASREKAQELGQLLTATRTQLLNHSPIVYISPMGLFAIQQVHGLSGVFRVCEMDYTARQNTWTTIASLTNFDQAVKVCKECDDEWLSNPRPATEGD